jgi:hypothetical protein
MSPWKDQSDGNDTVVRVKVPLATRGDR